MVKATGAFSAGLAAGVAVLYLNRRVGAQAAGGKIPPPERAPQRRTADDTVHRLRGFRSARNIRCWLTASVGILVYIGWACLLKIGDELGRDMSDPGSNPFTLFLVPRWDLGLGADVRTVIVPACLTLVATVTIASMTTASTGSSTHSPTDGDGSDVLDAVLATEVWLQTLATTAALAACLSVATAASFIPESGTASVPFLACAWFSCWVASGLSVQTNERIMTEEEQAAIQRHESVLAQVADAAPGAVDDFLAKGLTHVYLLVIALAVIPTAPWFVQGLFIMRSSGYSVGTLLNAWLQWGVLFSLCAFLPLFLWAAGAVHVALQSRILAWVYRVGAGLSYLALALVLGALIWSTSGELAPSLRFGLVLWLLTVAALVLFPRMNPLTRLALSIQAKQAQRRLSRLSGERGLVAEGMAESVVL